MSKSNAQSNLDTQLMLAAREGDVVKLQELIESGVAIDEVDHNGQTAFLHASINGEFDAAKLLLKAGANINARDNEGRTAAHLTIIGRSSQRTRRFLSQLLIKRKADLTVCDIHGFTPLMLCAKSRYYKLMRQGRPDLAKILIDAKVDVNYQNSNGWNALMFAAADGNLEICELLINAGVDVNYKNSNGWNALMFAAANGHEKICELLIKAGAWPLSHTKNDLIAILDLAKSNLKEYLNSMLENSKVIQEVGLTVKDLPASTDKIKAMKRHF